MSQLVQELWHRKLENWAIWRISGGTSASGSPYPAYRDYLPERGWWEQSSRPPQPLVGEALNVDALVTIIQGEGVQGYERYVALLAFYVWTGNLSDRARDLHIHPDTLNDRVRAARYRLEDLWQARHVAASVRRGNLLALAA